jgi:hypothetical protein
MTPPTWLDTTGRRRQPLACWTCGREVAPMRYRAADLRRHGWAPPQTLEEKSDALGSRRLKEDLS